MPIPRPAVIREVAETGVACQVARGQGDGAPGRIADQVVPQRGNRASTITVKGGITGENGIQEH